MRTMYLFSLLVCGVALGGCERADDSGPSFANLAGVAYVGDAACATCHEDLYASYQSHGMARSFYRWTVAERVEADMDEPLAHAASGFDYRVVADGDSLYQEETVRGADGIIRPGLRRRIDFVMGSGNAARTYFTEENGRLFQLPLTWYTQADDGAGRWDFSPGYETTNGRFDRLVPDRCMACHNSFPEAVPHVEGKYASLPEGIGCERCHGPGALHVAARTEDPEPPSAVDSTIVNPAHLTFDLRLDVCQQCHLQTTVDVLREGETAFSYRPAQPLAAHVAFFVAPEPEGTGVAVVSHADRMKRSACFLQSPSSRPLECTTCHDPHAGFRDRGPSYFNDTCLGCHASAPLQERMPTPALRAQHAPDANCFSCHMPRVEAGDAPHASFTDHYIRVVRAEEPAARDPVEPGPSDILAPYFERDMGTDEGTVYEGMATVVYGTQTADRSAISQGGALLANTLRSGTAEADTTHGEAHFLLGVAALRAGNLEIAVPALEQAVRLGPDVPQRLEALALAYEAAHRSPEVIKRLYRRALAVQPALATIRTNYGHFLQSEERRNEALDAYRAARAERPSHDGAALYEGTVLAELGRRGEAEVAFAEAVHLNPANAATLANFALVRDGGVEMFYAEPDAFGLAAQQDIAPSGGGVRFDHLPPSATVRVFSAAGAPIRTLQPGGAVPLVWDLRDDAGRPVGSGLYLVHVRTLGPAGETLGTRVFRIALAVTRVWKPMSEEAS